MPFAEHELVAVSLGTLRLAMHFSRTAHALEDALEADAHEQPRRCTYTQRPGRLSAEVRREGSAGRLASRAVFPRRFWGCAHGLETMRKSAPRCVAEQCRSGARYCHDRCAFYRGGVGGKTAWVAWSCPPIRPWQFGRQFLHKNCRHRTETHVLFTYVALVRGNTMRAKYSCN